jgi:hypothetical protein
MRISTLTNHTWLIYFIIGILLCAYGLNAFFLPWIELRHWEALLIDLEGEDYLPLHFRLLGLFAIGFGLFTASLAAIPYRAGVRWGWYTLWYIPVFLLCVMLFTPLGLSLSPVFMLSLAGLLFSYHRFFSNKFQENFSND